MGALLAAHDAPALEIGEIQVRSRLGEALDARVPLAVPKGEYVDGSCFTLVREPAAGSAVPMLVEGILSVHTFPGGRKELRIRSASALIEPAFALRLRAACAGDPRGVQRDFAVLLDPPRLAAQSAPPSLPSIATLTVSPGDTLRALAARVFPEDAAAQRRYLAAMRETNPAFASTGEDDPLPQQASIALPDLRAFGQARAPAPGAAMAEKPATPDTTSQPAIAAAARDAATPQAAGEAASPKAASEAATRKAASDVATPTRAAAPKAKRETSKVGAAPREGAAAREAPVAARATPVEREAQSAARAARAATTASPFVLKLSAPEVDLSRSRAIDASTRERLRERLRILDEDDHVAALLAMRHSLRQLETRVAELQLKLSTAPSAIPSAPVSTPPARSEVARPESAKAAAPKIESTKAEPPKIEPAKPEPAKIESAKIEPAKPEPAKVEPAKTEPAQVERPALVAAKEPPTADAPKADAPKPAASPPDTASRPAAKARAARPAAESEWIDGIPNLWLVAGAGAILLLLALAAWGARRRRRRDTQEFEPEHAPAEPVFDEQDQLAASIEREAVAPPRHSAPARIAPAPEAIVPPPARPEISSDAGLATRLPENSRELRRRYIEERFPEIANRTLVLDDPGSVVKAARLFYEDGAFARAVELLQFCIDEKPREVRFWLALFEIFRLERLPGEFAELAQRFREHHGEGELWRKVQFFGREIDPANALYREEPVDSLATIGPREARRAAAAGAFDPIAENWLEAPMDFENVILANELRQALMSEAKLGEQDLVPDPMPVLRNIEMFTVA